MMLLRTAFGLLLTSTLALAYQPLQHKQRRPTPAHAGAAAAAATAALTILLTTSPMPALASDSAAQIKLEQIPPTSISVEIGDLPVIGSLLSGTYSKVADGSIAKPSIVIKSPKDKVKAISSIATGGHLEFDVTGKLR